jgi:hypothetical protein
MERHDGRKEWVRSLCEDLNKTVDTLAKVCVGKMSETLGNADFQPFDLDESSAGFAEETASTSGTSANPRIYVKTLEFEGLNRTKENFIHFVLADCYYARDLQELSHRLNTAFQRLDRLNLFKDVAVVIDKAEGGKDDAEPFSLFDRPHEIRLLFKVKEKKWNIRTGTEFRRKDLVWNFGSVFFNLFGRAETLEIDTNLGANSATPFNVPCATIYARIVYFIS